jgi:serine/threonine protein kinase
MIPLGEKTDVWGIGNILWYLVAHRILDEGPVREYKLANNVDSDGLQLPYIPISSRRSRNRQIHNRQTTLTGEMFMAAGEYSDDIKNLVRACLNWKQENRPTLHDLYGAANAQLDDAVAQKTLREWEDFADALPARSNAFRIGDNYIERSDSD